MAVTLYFLLFMMVRTAFGQTVQKQYTLKTTSSGFTVKVGDIIIFEHSYSQPMISVGTGQTSFLSLLGNWRIDNHIQEKFELRNYTMQQSTGSDNITFQGDGYSVTMKLESSTNQSLIVTLTNNGSPYQYTWLRIKATATEKVWGGGEQFSHLNLRERSYGVPIKFSELHQQDQTYPIWIREQGVGRNKSNQITFFADLQTGGGGAFHTTYFPQPTYVSSQKYYFHYCGNNYAVLDFSNPQFHEVQFYGDVDKMYFKADSTLMNVVKALSKYLGIMPSLPDWVTDGMILGVQGGTSVMMQRYQESIDAGVAVNGLWIQDWAGQLNTSFGSRLFWNWEWDPKRYPDLKAQIQTLRKDGVRVFAYINPHLNVQGNIYKNVSGLGYFIKKKDGTDYIINFGEFQCATVDLTNQAAYNWYKGLIQTNMVDLGLGGWMADFGEYTPVDGVFTNLTGDIVHNLYPVLWAKLNREAIEERNKLGEIVFWMRAGYSGVSAYTTLMWAGDQNVDFDYADGLPSTVVSALSMGMSGTGMTHFDIGGYTTFGALGLQRSPELLLRSAEMAVFTPMMRSHEGNQPGYNVQPYSNGAMLQQFKRLTQLFTMLKNYTKNAILEYTNSGIPVQRPLFIMYENDQEAVNVKFQYMYGSDLLVAPVIESKASVWKVYLPTDNWVFLWNSTVYTGPRYVLVQASLGMPPVFYRNASTYRDTFVQMSKIKPIPLPVPPSGAPVTYPTCHPSVNSASKVKDSEYFISSFVLVFYTFMFKLRID